MESAVVNEARKRSVDNLQRLFTVVISLALTGALSNVFSGYLKNNGGFPTIIELLPVLGLIITIIPFYHGANRYLDSTYVTGERTAKQWALIIDFVALFVEGLAFFIISMFISKQAIFYFSMGLLLIFDFIWIQITKWMASSATDYGAKYIAWATANFAAAGFLILFSCTNMVNSVSGMAWLTFIILFIRTAIDYITVWDFYYPPDKDKYIMPVPRPAIPKKRVDSRNGKNLF